MEKLQQLRTSKSYSFGDMAKMLTISKTYYWQLEHNARRLSYDMAIKISKIFNMKPDDIFYDETKSKF